VGNPLAYLAIAVWPFIALAMFDRMSAPRAVIWSILGGYLLLPPITALSVPIVPDIDKTAAAALGGLFGLLLISRDGRLTLPASGLARFLMLLYVTVPLVSAAMNSDPIVAGPRFVPGTSLYDGLSFAVGNAVTLIPMLLAGSVLGTAAGAERLLHAFAIAGLAYSLPMVLEVRLSPQLNVWIYGFFAHDFLQMVRYGGFRPMVFLTHGLWVALFAFMAVTSSAAIARARGLALRPLLVVGYLFAVLIICKSAASILYALAVVPMILFATPRQQILLASACGLLVVGYPLLRYTGLLPADAIVAFIQELDPQRAQSLEFRFDNEEVLLQHAAERMMLGWSGWGRNLVYDPISGRAVTITDGRWIIVMGSGGIAGYLAEFGLLVLPIFAALRRAGSCPPPVAALTLIHAAALVDLLPNGTLTPLSWLLAGSLLAAVRTVGAGEGADLPTSQDQPAGRPRGPRVLLGRGIGAIRNPGPPPHPAGLPHPAVGQPMLGAVHSGLAVKLGQSTRTDSAFGQG